MPDRPGRALETTNPLMRSTGLGPARGVGAILGATVTPAPEKINWFVEQPVS